MDGRTLGREEVSSLRHVGRHGERLAQLGQDSVPLHKSLEVHARDPDHGGAAVLHLLKKQEKKTTKEKTRRERKKRSTRAVKMWKPLDNSQVTLQNCICVSRTSKPYLEVSKHVKLAQYTWYCCTGTAVFAFRGAN